MDHTQVQEIPARCLQQVRCRHCFRSPSCHSLPEAEAERTWTGEAGWYQKYNTTLLKKQAKREEFKLALSNKFQVLQEMLEEESINERLKTIKEAVTTVCQEVLGPKKPTIKNGFQRTP